MKKKINMNKIIAVGGGAVGALALNGLINKFASRVPAGMKKFIPVGKIVLGAYLLKKQKGMLADAGYGVIATGAIETATEFMPNLFAMNGIYGPGDLYTQIGNTNAVVLPIGDPVEYPNVVEEDDLVASTTEYAYEAYEAEMM